MFYLEKTTMEKSTTGKKTDFVKAQHTFADFSIKYIKNWTEQELKKYVNEPVVIPVGDYGFFVGPYRVTGKTKNCWAVVQQDGQHIHDFVSKSNAIIYCLKSMRNRSDYKDILELDRQLGKLDNDIAFYQHTINNTKNTFKNTIALNRYIDATLQRRAVLNILKKTLISAKYLNFGKLPL
jgi:mevalonate kinase